MGFDGNNDGFTESRDIPWLQDTDEADWWNTWNVTYRDVIILDADGEVADVYNLTNNDLGDTDNYVALKSLMLDAAQGN